MNNISSELIQTQLADFMSTKVATENSFEHIENCEGQLVQCHIPYKSKIPHSTSQVSCAPEG